MAGARADRLGYLTAGCAERIIADYSKSQSSCCGAIELYQSPAVTDGETMPRSGSARTAAMDSLPCRQTPAIKARSNGRWTIGWWSANRVPVADIDNYGVTGELEFPVSDSADLISSSAHGAVMTALSGMIRIFVGL